MRATLSFIKQKTGFLLAIVLAALVGGMSTNLVRAAIPDANGVISGCIRNNNDNLRIIDIENSESCSGAQTPISWDQSSDNNIHTAAELIAYDSMLAPSILDIPGFGYFYTLECSTGNIGGDNGRWFFENTSGTNLLLTSNASSGYQVMANNATWSGTPDFKDLLLLTKGTGTASETASISAYGVDDPTNNLCMIQIYAETAQL